MVQDNSTKPTVWQMIKSVLGAFFGVQSSQTRERDFSKGNPWVYVLIGIVGVTIFVLIVFGVVKLVVSQAGLANY